jgi:prepilin-type N-terminal cleavage/methylation domain-containing protein
MNKIVRQAFTLIELLVVIAIIGILSGLIIVTMSGATQKATIAKSQVFSNSLRNALMANLVSEWKFDQVTTDQTPDSWSGGNTCTLKQNGYAGACDSTHCPQLQTTGCISGNCLSFDGTDDYVDCGNSSNYLSGNFTIGVWANSLVKSWHYVLGNGLYNIANAFEIVERQGIFGYGVYYDTSSGQPLALPSNILTPGQWKYITITYDGSYLKIYIDGVYKNQVARTGNFSGNNLIIGDNGASGRYWYGFIDEVRIYNATIPTSQIKEQYYAGLNKLFTKGTITKEEYLAIINL